MLHIHQSTNFHIPLIFFHSVMLFFVWFLPLSFYGALSSCKMCFLRRACYAARNITFCPRCSDGHYSSALMHITNDEDWKNKTELNFEKLANLSWLKHQYTGCIRTSVARSSLKKNRDSQWLLTWDIKYIVYPMKTEPVSNGILSRT